MSKKKSHAGRGSKPPAGRRWQVELAACQDLLASRQLTRARDCLEDLNRRHPGHAEILGALVNVYHDLNDPQGYQLAAECFLAVKPEEANLWLGLAAAYMANRQPVSALHTVQRFLRRWPEHPQAAEARQTAADIEALLPDLLAELDLPAEEGLELAMQHEQSQAYLSRGDFHQSIRVAEALLQRYPTFAPALNNLSMAYWMEGETDKAIAAAQRVLETSPHDVHALSNLVHFLCTHGQVAQASEYARQMKDLPASVAGLRVKKAEAFSYLGDDQAVLGTWRAAEQAGEHGDSDGEAMLCHLAAVAMLRQGREKEARCLWQRALKVAPGFDLARENLDDLRKPVGERHAPWPFPLGGWLPPKLVQQILGGILDVVSKRGDAAVVAATRRSLKQYPGIVMIAPLLLDRGDPFGREMVLQMAQVSEDPHLLAALREFALCQRGPDKMRLEAAQMAVQEGLLPSGATRMWVNGEWQEVMLMGFLITDKPTKGHSSRVEKLARQAILALRDRDVVKAENALKQALALEPDSPDLLNNLAMAYEMQGRWKEGIALAEEVSERFPDYLFGRVAMARLAAQQGDTGRAHQLLDPLLQRRELHTTEFSALCGGFVELHLAEKNTAAARSWCDMWKTVLPDDPDLAKYRLRIVPQRLGDAVSRRLFRRRS
jgi:tetratricopeptide (TPR) repeat protein